MEALRLILLPLLLSKSRANILTGDQLGSSSWRWCEEDEDGNDDDDLVDHKVDDDGDYDEDDVDDIHLSNFGR